MNTMPFAAQNSESAGRNPVPGTTNPPSPSTGSAIRQATWVGPMWRSISSIASAAQASPHASGDAPAGHRYGYAYGSRYTSGAYGPNPSLYVDTLAVSVIAIMVRPWNACPNATTPLRPVACRAIFTAFSTASAPEFTSMVRFTWSPGVSAFSRSASSRYGSL